jgi:hypothetical protein
MASVHRMKILIAGDSFAAKWPNQHSGWVNLLEKDYSVTNIAQAGVGEYKILKQLESVNPNLFDLVIVSHTSPSRVHTPQHPTHKSGFHKNCDLIFADIEEASSCFNKSLQVAKGWFKYHYDDNYQMDIYQLVREKINNIINVPYISMSHITLLKNVLIEKDFIDFSDLWTIERGNVNHYTDNGNEVIYKIIKEKIKNYD